MEAKIVTFFREEYVSNRYKTAGSAVKCTQRGTFSQASKRNELLSFASVALVVFS